MLFSDTGAFRITYVMLTYFSFEMGDIIAKLVKLM